MSHHSESNLYTFFTPLLSAFTPRLPAPLHTACVVPSGTVCPGSPMDFLYLFLLAFFTVVIIGLIHGLDMLGDAS